MINFSITQFGKPLDKSRYTWDEATKTLSALEADLVLDFAWIMWITFKTGSHCTFDTGSYCTFTTGSYCTFTTGSDCTFKTGSHCTFETGSYCTFDTWEQCVVIRRDVYEVIELEEWREIKLNWYEHKGFIYTKEEKKIVTLELTDDQLEQIKNILN